MSLLQQADGPPAETLDPAIRVLVADDDPDMRSFIAEPLRRRAYQVIEVEDGTQLLDYVHTRFPSRQPFRGRNPLAPRLIIADVMMPGCDGLTIISSLRQWGWDLPIILISALGDDDYIYEEASRLNVTAYFQKPFEIKDLCETVEITVRGVAEAW